VTEFLQELQAALFLVVVERAVGEVAAGAACQAC